LGDFVKLLAKNRVMKHDERWLRAGIEAALQAGAVIRKHYLKKIEVKEKGTLGLVTNVDVEAEKVAMKVLRKAEPNFGFLTEETNAHGVQRASQDGLWIVDPLDGTTNFVHGFPMFCVTVAAEIDGEVIAGVTYHPILNELYTAVKGKGAYVNKVRLQVSKTKLLKNSLLATGFAYSKSDILKNEMSSFEKASRAARAVRRPGSAALDLAYTARGVFDGFWERHLSAWDVAAGSLLVTEAGGKVTTFSGKKFDTHGPEILATNGKIHTAIRTKVT
jgi:myo-inositol-1(or 4)-monophosphatase